MQNSMPFQIFKKKNQFWQSGAGLEFQRESESPLSQRLPQMNPQESS